MFAQHEMRMHPAFDSPKRKQTRDREDQLRAFENWYVSTSITREIPKTARILRCK